MIKQNKLEGKVFDKALWLGIILAVMMWTMLCSSVYGGERSNRMVTINGEFPVTFWWPPPPDKTTPANYKTIAEAGFTLTLGGNGVVEKGDNVRVLEYTESLGMQAIIIDKRIHNMPAYDEIPAWVDRYIDLVIRDYQGYESLAGFLLADEPAADRFKILGKLNNALLDKVPELIPYINLYPTYATSGQLGVPTYEEYVDLFMRTVRPKILSFDFYPFVATGAAVTDRIRDDFFWNLEIIRKKSLEYDTPFWAFVQTCRFAGMRNPSPAEVRWQTYQNLAYGAKGIQYFLYWSLPDGNSEQIMDGIVTNDGRKTEHYSTVKQLNSELRALGKTLLSLTSEGVYHSYGLPPYSDENYKPDWLADVSGDPVVIGVFSGSDASKYLMIVNRSFLEKANARITVKGDYNNVAQISKTTGEAIEIPTSVQTDTVVFNVQLVEGDGILIKLE